MSEYYQHKQNTSPLDDCLVKMARIIQSLGVEELTITSDTHQHVINSVLPVDKLDVDCFVSQIDQLYTAIVVPARGGGPAF